MAQHASRSIEETTALVRAQMTTKPLSAADKRWLRLRHRDLIILHIEAILAVIYLVATIYNLLMMFIGLGIILLVAIIVIAIDLIHPPK